MRQFFKFFFASMFGFLFAIGIGFFIFTIIIVGIFSSIQEKDKVEIDPNSILKVKLNYQIMERTSNDPLRNFDFESFKPRFNLGLDKVIDNINKAADDDNIKGIYLNLTMIPTGWATVEAIRNALIDFKASGKFIVGYSEFYTQRGFYLASVADDIYLNPAGIFDFRGFSIDWMFFKNALDKLEIQPQIFYAGKYKSATEPFRLDRMSDENQVQLSSFLNSNFNHYLSNISSSIGIEYNVLDSIVENLLIRKPEDAKRWQLVDDLLYEDELFAHMRDRLGIDEDAKINFITMNKFSRASKRSSSYGKDKIAVVYAEGDIVFGKGEADEIGSATFAKAIRKARLDDKVKAIVLRINSPGGFALAADLIWREVALAREAKPVVVSMGNYAASGGYYIACAADTIVAEANTLTGSIGVFGMLLNIKNFFDHKLGITFDRVKTSRFADLGNPSRPITDEERAIIQVEVDRIYSDFKEKVAEGREMDIDYVDSIAQGRIWTGTQAREVGLVDVIGGMTQAVEIASDMADLEEYRIVKYPKAKDLLQLFLDDYTMNMKDDIASKEIGAAYPYYKQLKKILVMDGIHARIPFFIEVD